MKDSYCEDCAYYAASVGSCDYWLIEDRLRGCPGGPGCTKKITKKEYIKMNPAGKWDKAAGMKMWQEGKTDKEIAEEFCVTPSAVCQVRKKYWEPKKMQNAECKMQNEPANVAPAELVPEEIPTEKETDPSAPRCSAQDDRAFIPDEGVPCVGGPEGNGEAWEDPEEMVARRMIRLLEDMTANLKGMDAVMTAQLVTALYHWDSLADLKAARLCLDYLIERHGA